MQSNRFSTNYRYLGKLNNVKKSFLSHFGIKTSFTFFIFPCLKLTLVESFNHETRNTGWVSIRGYYNHALIDEFIRRGINVSAVYDGNAISLSHPVQYDEENKKLVVPPEASNSTTTFEIY